jgi:hypothetical protein
MRSSRHPRPTVLLLRDPDDKERLLTRPTRSRDRLIARLLAPSLDRQLAAGRPPECHRLLATRAQTLVSPEDRRALAARWEHLLEVARIQPARAIRRVPLCRDRIVGAESAVQDMLRALEAPSPVSARGAAMASILLSDGAGPLYNRQSSVDLIAAVREATAELDPWTSPVMSTSVRAARPPGEGRRRCCPWWRWSTDTPRGRPGRDRPPSADLRRRARPRRG